MKTLKKIDEDSTFKAYQEFHCSFIFNEKQNFCSNRKCY